MLMLDKFANIKELESGMGWPVQTFEKIADVKANSENDAYLSKIIPIQSQLLNLSYVCWSPGAYAKFSW